MAGLYVRSGFLVVWLASIMLVAAMAAPEADAGKASIATKTATPAAAALALRAARGVALRAGFAAGQFDFTIDQVGIR